MENEYLSLNAIRLYFLSGKSHKQREYLNQTDGVSNVWS